MCAKMFLPILCMQLVFSEVYSAENCDRFKGPPGLTDCVKSSLYPKPLAAICLSKDRISIFTHRHITCKWRDAQYCWFLCSATHSHGGLSACECDPKFSRQGKSDNITCYVPTGQNSWFSECLKKTKNCPKIKETEQKFKEWDNLAQKLSENGKSWIKSVKNCIQKSLVHLLYPQVVYNDCETIKSKIELATEACHLTYINQYCKITWFDTTKIFFSKKVKLPKRCSHTPAIPPWATILVFYLKYKPGTKISNLAYVSGETFSEYFGWKKDGLTYKALAPDFFNKKSTSIPIRVYLYSETEQFEKVPNSVRKLKNKLATHKTSAVITKHIEVNSVMMCNDPECLTYILFPFKTDDPSCKAKGGKCQNGNTPCQGGYYTRDHCYYVSRDKCCVKFLDKSSCKAAGGECKDTKHQCKTGSYIFGHCGNDSHIMKCCLEKYQEQDTGECKEQDLPILSRDTWGAAHPTGKIFPIDVPVRRFFIHHTDTGRCENLEYCSRLLRSVQNDHMGRDKWYDIGYNFLIAESGRVFEGRGWNNIGVHTKKYNEISFAASFIGNFAEEWPTKKALESAVKLLECGVNRGVMEKNYSLYGHYDVTTGNAACPGYNLYNKIRKWPNYNNTADGDGSCLKKGGRCKPNYLPCSGGRYHPRLCEGNYQRQCCINNA